MENFDCTTVEDLLLNASFRRSLHQDATEDAAFWQRWEAENPDKQEMIRQARAIILALPARFTTLDQAEASRQIASILQLCDIAPTENSGNFQMPQAGTIRMIFKRQVARWCAAAAILLIVVLTGWHILSPGSSHDTISYAPFAHTGGAPLQDQANHSGTVKLIRLEDGTKVYLENNSRLTWQKDFAGKRDVCLDGEAFFDVAANNASPFVVYTKYIITRVLGTSFRVRAWPADQQGSVAVTTGKVSVSRRDAHPQQPSPGKDAHDILLLPNQEATYNNALNAFDKGIVNTPAPITAASGDSFVFKATPVEQVFQRLRSVYGIEIVYDTKILSHCSLTAVLDNESFYDKLNLICIAINATYKVVDGKVLIDSKGCKKP